MDERWHKVRISQNYMLNWSVFTIEEVLNNGEDRMTQAAEVYQTLALVTSELAKWVHEGSDYSGRDEDSSWLPQNKADIASTNAKCPNPNMVPFLEEHNWLHGVRLTTFGSFQPGKNKNIDTYSGLRFAFPACMASASTTIQGLIECFFLQVLDFI